jgi:hypothetical protein
MRLALPSSVVEHVLARAQLAFIDDALDVAVVLASNTITNFVARGLPRHRHNKKSRARLGYTFFLLPLLHERVCSMNAAKFKIGESVVCAQIISPDMPDAK